MAADRRATRVRIVLLTLACLAVVVSIAFLTVDVRGPWSFVLPLRGVKLAALITVATAIAVSTVLFQTVTGNRILTPSIIGFDALYLLAGTLLVFVLGPARVSVIDPRVAFVADTVMMVAFSLVLFRLLLERAAGDLTLLLLAGVVCGILFRSVTSLLQRLIDPAAFVVLQQRMFAGFDVADGTLVGVAAALVAIACLSIVPSLADLDVSMLGRERAVSLGVEHARLSRRVMVVVAVLVAAATALVGPVTFFGLVVAAVAGSLMPTARHRHLLPAAIGVAIVALVGGQLVLERVFAFDTVLAVVIEFTGGLFFLFRLSRGGVR